MSTKEIDWTTLNTWQRKNHSIAYGIVTAEWIQEVLTEMKWEGRFTNEEIWEVLKHYDEPDDDWHDSIVDMVIETLTGEVSKSLIERGI